MSNSVASNAVGTSFKPIPSHFNRCSGRTCFCIEGNGFFLKPLPLGKSCVVCFSGDFELNNPQSCCALYQQIFCCECFLTSECNEKGYYDPPLKPTHVASNVVPEELDGANVLLGGWCSLASIYINLRSMYGTYHRQNMFCFENEFVAARCLSCQPELQHERPNTLCILYQGHSSFVHSFSYIKTVSQCLCLDIRFILPFSDREVPSVCTWVPMCTVCAAGCPHVTVFKTIREFATLAYPETPYHPNRAHEIERAASHGPSNDTDIQFADVVVVDNVAAKSFDESIVYADTVIAKL